LADGRKQLLSSTDLVDEYASDYSAIKKG